MNDETKKSSLAESSAGSNESEERREFLKNLGKYSVVTSATTVTLLSSKRSAASLGGSISPPGGPGTLGS